MAAIIYQLSVFVLLVITLQTLVAADDLQDYEDYEESNGPRELLNFLKMLSLRPWISSTVPIDNNVAVDDVDEQDERQARSFGPQIYEGQEILCMTTTQQKILSDSNYEYRPSILDEKVCQPVTGVLDQHFKGICYVRGNNCRTVFHEVTVFKRQRHAGHCWEPEIRNISDGCRCYFERHNLRGKSYTG